MDTSEHIWRWLWLRIGNNFGVAGLMGNLCAESALRPNNLQNSYEKLLGMSDDEYTKAVDSKKYTKDEFIHDGAGYGLAQWTYSSRKKALYEATVEKGKSIGDLNAQLNFMWLELSDYKSVTLTLFNATSIREASDAVMTKYEIPADLSENNMAVRAEYGLRYYDLYAVKDIPINQKAETIVRLAKERLGCPYVFGATGQIRNGKQVFDCRGFTYWLLKQVNILISSVGATTQYNTAVDWAERGLIKDIPNVVCPVFKYRESDGKMAHTGMHIGDGIVIHCTQNGGVKYGSLSDKTWTHYAIPNGLYTADEIEAARGKDVLKTLKVGCSGEDVKALQVKLNELGYSCGTPDGIFGQKTKTAVQAFQSAKGLSSDGIVGPLTLEMLASTYSDQNDEQTDADHGDSVKIPRKLAAELYEALGVIFDCRGETLTNIDYE